MDSDLAWVNGKSGRQSWRYADAFQRSIISEAIYHFFTILHKNKMVISREDGMLIKVLHQQKGYGSATVTDIYRLN